MDDDKKAEGGEGSHEPTPWADRRNFTLFSNTVSSEEIRLTINGWGPGRATIANDEAADIKE